MTMSQPVVIAVAITGSVPRKKDTPAVPITTAEQVESTHEAFEAGATLVVQRMHVGRMSHPSNTPNGRAPLAPSAVAARGGEGLQVDPLGIFVHLDARARDGEAPLQMLIPGRSRVGEHGARLTDSQLAPESAAHGSAPRVRERG